MRSALGCFSRSALRSFRCSDRALQVTESVPFQFTSPAPNRSFALPLKISGNGRMSSGPAGNRDNRSMDADADHVTRPHLSILIVNWNTRDLVLRCLESLAAATEGIRREVIVVDNGSVDGSPDALARRTDITLLENETNLGFASAVNQAYKRSSGELVLLLNSDVGVAGKLCNR